MKALSIRGDYIMQIILGEKPIEYRTWKTKYRGPLLLCSTTKRVKGAVPGKALCVVNLKDVQWDPDYRIYNWYIELAYLIKPVHVKGQLKLFSVDDSIIKPVKSKTLWWARIEPMIYRPKPKKNKKK